MIQQIQQSARRHAATSTFTSTVTVTFFIALAQQKACGATGVKPGVIFIPP